MRPQINNFLLDIKCVIYIDDQHDIIVIVILSYDFCPYSFTLHYDNLISVVGLQSIST